MKQTAVEWLVEKIQQANPTFKFDALIREAIKMEKEQMKNACIQHSYENKSFQKLLEKQFEQYYNKTFKSE